MTEIKLDNGWIVSKSGINKAILHVHPLKNSIFRKEQDVILPDEIYNAISQGDLEIKSLFKKYKLHNLILQWDNREPETTTVPSNTKNIFYGKGFIAEKENISFFLTYELSGHGGGNRKIPISEDIYLEARTGNYTVTGLFRKYNLYHLDVPENDVK